MSSITIECPKCRGSYVSSHCKKSRTCSWYFCNKCLDLEKKEIIIFDSTTGNYYWGKRIG